MDRKLFCQESSYFSCKKKRVAAYISYICVASLLSSKRDIFIKMYFPSKHNDVVYIINLEYFSAN